MRRMLPWAAVAALLLAPGAGLIALAFQDDTPEALLIDPEPVLSEPTERVVDGEQPARLTFDIGEPVDVLSAGASGVVTAVHAEPGARLDVGDAVYSVNGIERRAMAGNEPLYRDVAAEDRGADVERIERYLQALGYLDAEPDEFFGWESVLATREFEGDVGAATPTGVFSVDLVVWLPQAPFAVGEVVVRVAEPAPGAGEPVIRSPAPVTGAQLQAPDGGALTLLGPSTVEFQGEAMGEISELSEIPSGLVYKIAAASKAESANGDGEEGNFADVTLRLTEPRESLSVPSSAIMVGADGADTCVWTRAGEGYEPVSVTVVDGTLGSTDIEGPVASREILANPIDVLGDAECR